MSLDTDRTSACATSIGFIIRAGVYCWAGWGWLVYSWADIWVSVSRQALSFRRRHTQHRPSLELGAHSLLHTTQWAGLMRSSSIARLACSMIASGTTDSLTGSAASGVRLRFTVPL